VRNDTVYLLVSVCMNSKKTILDEPKKSHGVLG
jgi:hypothetical protein